MVDRQPVPATVSRCRTQSFLSQILRLPRVTVGIRLRAVTEVNDGAPVGEVAERYGVTRQTITAWRTRYDAGGLDALTDQSRRPHASPGRIAPDVEALICDMRRHHRRWGARRIAFEMKREIGNQAPSRSTTRRVLVRNGLVNMAGPR